MSGLGSCRVCSDVALRAGVDELLAVGTKYTETSRIMAARGFTVGTEAISNHNKHRVAVTMTEPPVKQRDILKVIQARMGTVIEDMDDETLMSKEAQPAIANAIKAQSAIDKREDRATSRKIDLFKLMLGQGAGGAMPPPDLIGEPEALEGEFEDVTADDATGA